MKVQSLALPFLAIIAGVALMEFPNYYPQFLRREPRTRSDRLEDALWTNWMGDKEGAFDLLTAIAMEEVTEDYAETQQAP